MSQLLVAHGVTLPVKRYVESQITTRNIFGTPQGYTPQESTAKVLVAYQYLDDQGIEAGSKPKEVVVFLCPLGTLIEHDEVTYDEHVFKIKEVTKAPMGGTDRLEMATGSRVVEP